MMPRVGDPFAEFRQCADKASERSLLGLGVWVTGWRYRKDYIYAEAPAELAPATVIFYWPRRDLLIAAKPQKPYIVWKVNP